jgi:hypothetical protein
MSLPKWLGGEIEMVEGGAERVAGWGRNRGGATFRLLKGADMVADGRCDKEESPRERDLVRNEKKALWSE